MRILLALVVVVATACGGPKAKPEGAIVNERTETPENCCCKSNPMTSADGMPVYEMGNRMECSSKQGECVPDVQCDKAQPDDGASSAPSSAPSE